MTVPWRLMEAGGGGGEGQDLTALLLATPHWTTQTRRRLGKHMPRHARAGSIMFKDGIEPIPVRYRAASTEGSGLLRVRKPWKVPVHRGASTSSRPPTEIRTACKIVHRRNGVGVTSTSNGSLLRIANYDRMRAGPRDWAPARPAASRTQSNRDAVMVLGGGLELSTPWHKGVSSWPRARTAVNAEGAARNNTPCAWRQRGNGHRIDRGGTGTALLP